MYKVSRAFLPMLKCSKGALVNNLSLMALAPLPLTPSYAISKAAALSMTQSLRALLANEEVKVHGVFLGPVDTDMTRGFEIPKASPQLQDISGVITQMILRQSETKKHA